MKEHITENGYFYYEEWLVSKDHPLLVKDIHLDDHDRDKILLWVQSIGDVFRKAYPDTRIVILSGKRSQALNDAVGGHPNSDHLFCNAVDYYSPDEDIDQVFANIIGLKVPYRHLILYPKRRFIHHSFNVPGRYWKEEVKIKQ